MKHLSKPQMKALKALSKVDKWGATAGRLNARSTTMNSLVDMGLSGKAWNSGFGWIWSITDAGRQYIGDGRTESLLLSKAQWGALRDLYDACDGYGSRLPLRTAKALKSLGLVHMPEYYNLWELTELGRKLVEAKR